jgi:hypothetical protein
MENRTETCILRQIRRIQSRMVELQSLKHRTIEDRHEEWNLNAKLKELWIEHYAFISA